MIVLSKLEIQRLKRRNISRKCFIELVGCKKRRLRLAVCSREEKDKHALQLLSEMEFISGDRGLMKEGNDSR